MDEYTVEITETLQRDVTVKAADADDALDKVRAMYRNSEVVLDSGDFDGVVVYCEGREATP